MYIKFFQSHHSVCVSRLYSYGLIIISILLVFRIHEITKDRVKIRRLYNIDRRMPKSAQFPMMVVRFLVTIAGRANAKDFLAARGRFPRDRGGVKVSFFRRVYRRTTFNILVQALYTLLGITTKQWKKNNYYRNSNITTANDKYSK